MLAYGQILAGKYRVERTLGEGGFGVVVEATHLVLGERVAIKVLKPALAADQAVVARLLREARSAARIRGEHVPRVLDVGSVPGEPPFIVMELLRGNDLAKLLATRGALPVATAIDHVLQAGAALAEAHALGIVHRDIKPSNLFLATRPDGSACIKVLDFGIAKAAPAPDAPPSFTRTQDILGTPLYMAPEQMRSAKVVDRRTDVWALGATLYELVAGKPAFDGATISDIYAMVLTESAPPLGPAVPPAVAAAIGRCLEKKPEHRFPDVASFLAAIAPFGTGRVAASAAAAVTGASSPASLPLAPVTTPDTLPAQPHTIALGTIARPSRGRRAVRALATAVAALAAVAAFLVFPRARGDNDAHAAPIALPAAPSGATPDVAPAESTTEPLAVTPLTPPSDAAETAASPARTAPKTRPAKPKRSADARSEDKPAAAAAREAPAPAISSPRGVATSRFE